jgi:branched-chain amino acid transport system permease protein
LNIVVGFARLLDLAYVAFFPVGPSVYALLGSAHFDIHWPFFVLLPLGAAVACVFGVLLGAPTLRLRGDYLAIVTLGFGEIIRVFLNNLHRPINITNGPLGITLIDPIRFGDFSLSQQHTIAGITFAPVHSYYYLFLTCVLLSIFVSLRLEDSRIGRAWIAIREDEVAAKSMGIHTRNVKLLAFAMGASFGGLSGGLFAAFQGFVSPESFALLDSIMILCMVVLGGMGHVPGVVLGALLLTALPEALRYVGPLQQAWLGRVVIDPSDLRMLLFGLALVLMMLFRPAGLWPSRVRKRELAQ